MVNRTDIQLFEKASTIFNELETSQEEAQAQKLTRSTQSKVVQKRKSAAAGSVRDLMRLSNLVPAILITCPVAVVIAGSVTLLSIL